MQFFPKTRLLIIKEKWPTAFAICSVWCDRRVRKSVSLGLFTLKGRKNYLKSIGILQSSKYKFDHTTLFRADFVQTLFRGVTFALPFIQDTKSKIEKIL